MDNMYLTSKYNSKSRWLSYWYQISETLEVSPASVLVIGKGSGFTENSIKLLTNKKTKVLTLDINSSLIPDTVGDITHLPLKKESFDASLCCQVLEHIPFEQFSPALSELHRVTRKRVVLSLPHGRKHIRISYNVSKLGEKNIIIKNPLTKKICTARRHHWEIGRSVSRKQLISELLKFFTIEKEFFNEINCYHRFFILKKK